MNSFFDNPAAIAPFLDETIVVDGVRRSDGEKRTLRLSLAACVIDNGFSEPISSGDADSDVRIYSITVRASDWTDATPPQIGDRVTLGNGRRLALSDVGTISGSVWTLSAREVK